MRGLSLATVVGPMDGSMGRCKFLRNFLAQYPAATLKAIHVVVALRGFSGNKAALLDSIMSLVDEQCGVGRQTAAYCEVLAQFTATEIRRFLSANRQRRKGFRLGTTKDDAIAAFIALDVCADMQVDARMDAPRPARAAAQVGVTCTAIVPWVPLVPEPLPAEPMHGQLVERQTGRTRLSNMLRRLWRKGAKRKVKTDLSRKIKVAVAAACVDRTRTIGQIRVEVESAANIKFDGKPHASAFFTKQVFKHIKLKVARTRTRPLIVADLRIGNPLLEYQERRRLEYEDSLSEALLR